jgi:hypothetical protein
MPSRPPNSYFYTGIILAAFDNRDTADLLFTLGFYRYIDDFNILQWLVCLVHLDIFNIMYDFQSCDCPPEDGMLLV